MPWCEECSELLEDEEVDDDGTCPHCGTEIVEGSRRPVPWYFKFMIVATVVYLMYRTYQGITWLIHHV